MWPWANSCRKSRCARADATADTATPATSTNTATTRTSGLESRKPCGFTEVIADELSRSDPAHAAGYQARAAVAIERLNKMLDEGKAMLAAKSEKPRLITFHDSLQYFARAFGIEIADTIEAPGQEPSPKKLAKLVAVCRDKGVRLIAVEPQYPSHNSARAVGGVAAARHRCRVRRDRPDGDGRARRPDARLL